MEKKILFKTVHGSHLYGLAHEGSDNDFYTVLDKQKNARAKYARQKIYSDGTDSMVVDFGTWLMQCESGVPQALEAMFSQSAMIDEIPEFRAGYQVRTSAAPRYLRTITSFCYTQDFKRKRHGLRLALNMYDFSHTGRFNPLLSDNEADFVTENAKKDCDAVYALAMSIALDRQPPGMIR